MTNTINQETRESIAQKASENLLAINAATDRLFDAVQIDVTETGHTRILAWLEVLAIENTSQRISAIAYDATDFKPNRRMLPLDTVVWLLKGPFAPARRASLLNSDPILDIPGEGDAFKIRTLAHVDSYRIIDPNDLCERLYGIFPVVKERGDFTGHIRCGYSRKDKYTKLYVNSSGGMDISQSSLGISISMWFVLDDNNFRSDIYWNEIPFLEETHPEGFLPVFNTYQALRAPALRLLLEFRALHLPPVKFLNYFSDRYKLPFDLVKRRLTMLLNSGIDI